MRIGPREPAWHDNEGKWRTPSDNAYTSNGEKNIQFCWKIK